MMEDVMNRIVRCLLVCAIGLPGIMVQAQSKDGADNTPFFSSYATHQTTDVARVEKKYLAALKMDNDGVVEAALAHITRMKLYRPCETCKELVKKIHSLAVDGHTPAIRFRAYLASVAMDSPELFAREQRVEYRDPEEMFVALSTRLQTSLLGYNEKKNDRIE
jgi:hypothetical protein